MLGLKLISGVAILPTCWKFCMGTGARNSFNANIGSDRCSATAVNRVSTTAMQSIAKQRKQ
jgi:hypothetical protein